MNTSFKPFASESAVVGIGELALENRSDRVCIHGRVDLTKDKAGLKLALELKARIDDVVAVLRSSPLPEQIATGPAGTVKNSFNG